MPRSRRRFAASANEDCLFATRRQGTAGDLRLAQRPHPPGAGRVRAAIVETIANLAEFPRSGQSQTVRGVRNARVRRYTYNVYDTVDAAAGWIGLVSIQHTSRAPEFRDA